MRSFAEFILEANVAADAGGKRGPRKAGESLQDYMKRTRGVDVSGHADLSSDEQVRKSGKSRPGAQTAAQNTAQTRSTRTQSGSSARQQYDPKNPKAGNYGGEYYDPAQDNTRKTGAKRQAVKDAFNRGKQVAQDLKQKAGEKASKVKQAVRDVASKAADTTPRQAAQSVKNAASKATQGLKDFGSKVKDSAQNAPNDLKTKLKYGRKIRPNSSTSALATRSTDLAKAANTTSKFSKGLRLAGRAAAPIGFAADVASERAKGSGWLRSLAKGAVTAAGGAAGAAGGSAAGPVGTVAGGIGGAAAASKAFDVVAGKNAKERAADRLANRKRQAGGALVGTGGKTSFDTKKNTMTTGGKTVKLGKTSAVTDPKTGKTETGYLAYKGGKAVYKRADKPGTGTSNAFERIGRAINPNAYKANDAKLAAQKLNQAKASDAARNKALGIKPKK